MQPDELEQRLQRLPRRELPAEWREQILAACGAPSIARQEHDPASVRPSDARRSDLAWWLAWLNPTRAGWTALGAAWLVILTLHFAGSEGGATAPTATATLSPEQWFERQRLMAELIDPAEPVQPPAVTRPRSERRVHPLFHHA
jgi:hypothetical protein